ncbi:hypothetical protein EJ110_NYTH30565 [Nymphaea thermarum]|nr:hypothetical protein EJ110_NYTH30565 [Nymphaea thermarum]
MGVRCLGSRARVGGGREFRLFRGVLQVKEKEKRSWPTYLLPIKTKPMAMGSSSAKHRCFTRRCSRLVKEQKARLYILRQCATMLVCWYIHGDD